MTVVRTNISETVEALLRARGTLADLRKSILEVIGIRVLSFAQQDYRVKARHGTGEDGVKWRPLERATLEARVRRRKPARTIVLQRDTLARQIRVILLAKPRPVGWKQKVRNLRQKRKELSGKLKGLIDAEVANHEIGVDTGLQRSSASPGFTAADGKGGSLFVVEETSVTVGYNREYSAFFDADRPLYPDKLPTRWEDEIDRLVEVWAERILIRELSSGFN